MNYDVDSFDDDQKKFLSYLVSDVSGPTSMTSVLHILERVLYECKPDWEMDPQALSADLRKDVEVCLAALHYSKVDALAKAS